MPAMASNISSVALDHGEHNSKRDLPKMTVGTSRQYNEQAYSILANAMMPNPMWKIMFTEGKEIPHEERLKLYRTAIKGFHDSRAQKGAFVAEAGDFAACALWWPPGSQEPPQHMTTRQVCDGQEVEESEDDSDKIERELIWSKHGNDFWQLGLIGRDPNKPAVAGAVRAVLQPFIDQAARDQKPMWLKTTSEHAKDIYLHFGWEIVKEVTSSGHKMWAMLLLPSTSRC